MSAGVLIRPSAAVVSTRLAKRERAIMAAEKMPKLAKSPIGDRAMTRKPALVVQPRAVTVVLKQGRAATMAGLAKAVLAAKISKLFRHVETSLQRRACAKFWKRTVVWMRLELMNYG